MPRSRSWPSTLRWWCVLVGLAVVTACSGVPTTGPVHFAKTLPGAAGDDDSTVRQLPPGPTADESPTSLVEGFLNAVVDSDGNYVIAHAFLAPDTSWTTEGTTVYGGDPTITRVGPNRVDVHVSRLGHIDARGAYTTDPGDLHVQFRVERLASGDWRITRPPAGVLLSTTDAQRLLTPVEIYYLNHDQTRLVPDPILVSPDESGLATTLMMALLAAPNRDLASAVSTAAPPGTALVGNVPIDAQGVADVELSDVVEQAPPAQQAKLLAQIVWTLRQVSSVTAVRVLANGSPLSAPGVAATLSVDSLSGFDPNGAPAVNGALASDNGKVVSLLGGSLPVVFAHTDLVAPRRSADGAIVAALAEHGGLQTLVVGGANGVLRTPLAANTFSAPAFDPAGDVFFASGVGSAATVTELTTTERVHVVDVPKATLRLGIGALAISRDGARMAFTAGPAGHQGLYVGALGGTAERPVVAGVTLVIPPAESVSGLAWAGADEIATTALGTAGRRVVLTTGVDGYLPREFSTSGMDSEPTDVAAAPGQPTLAAAGGAIWSFTGGRWQRVSTGIDPSYAG